MKSFHSVKAMKIVKAVLLSILTFSVISCKESKEVELTIFHTNDLHSHFNEIKTDPFDLGGLARMSTLLARLREQSPAALTLDAGDWSEGAWSYSIDQGANMLRVMSMMGFDATCLGNHDFLQGPDELIKTVGLANPSFPVLAANLDMSNYSKASDLARVILPTSIKKIGGVRVGIIGLTTFEMLYDKYMEPVKITDVVTSTTKEVLALRTKVDVLILLSHNSFAVNEKLAMIPGLDAVISGHSHVKTPKPVFVNNLGRQIPVVETGSWGRFIGDLKLTVDKTKRLAKFKSYQLHPVSLDLVEDPSIVGYIAEQKAALDAKFGVNTQEVIAHSDVELLRDDNQESLLGNLAVQAYRRQTGADLALEQLSFTGVSVPKGEVTREDLHDVIPHLYNAATGKEWMLNVWNARGVDLLMVISVFHTMSGLMPLSNPAGWLSTENANVVWDPGAKIPMIHSVEVGDKPLDLMARYKVALTEGLLDALQQANVKFHLQMDLSQVMNTGVEAWQAVTSYAQSLRRLTLETLKIGKRARTVTPDLAIFYYDMEWDGNTLSLIAHNNGLQASQSGRLTCYSGIPNDAVLYQAHPVDLEKWSEIGSVTIPPIGASGSVAVDIPWSSANLVRGYWPVKCDLTTSGDPYDVNNHLTHVLRF